jgi:hypothetical protein
MWLRAKQTQRFSFFSGTGGLRVCLRGAVLRVCTRLEAVCPMWLCDDTSLTCGRAGKSGAWALPRRLQFPLVCAPLAPSASPPCLFLSISFCFSLCLSLSSLCLWACAWSGGGGELRRVGMTARRHHQTGQIRLCQHVMGPGALFLFSLLAPNTSLPSTHPPTCPIPTPPQPAARRPRALPLLYSVSARFLLSLPRFSRHVSKHLA